MDSLPIELLEKVVFDPVLGIKDLLSLRLTCKAFVPLVNMQLSQRMNNIIGVSISLDFHGLTRLYTFLPQRRHMNHIRVGTPKINQKYQLVNLASSNPTLRNVVLSFDFAQGIGKAMFCVSTILKGARQLKFLDLQPKTELRFPSYFDSRRMGRIHRYGPLRTLPYEETVFQEGDKILTSITSDQLTELNLRQVAISATNLLRVLLKNSRSLRQLSFEDCLLRGDWTVVMTRVRDSLALETLCVRHLLHVNRLDSLMAGYCPEDYYINQRKLRGGRQIRSMIRNGYLLG